LTTSERQTGVYGNNRPDIVVDNVIINGDWGDFDNYKQKFETDEDFILIKMKGLFVFLYDNDTRSCLSEFCMLHKQLLCAL